MIKADGLAAGKGVYICKSYEEGLTAAKEIFGGKFGSAKSILIEEFLVQFEIARNERNLCPNVGCSNG